MIAGARIVRRTSHNDRCKLACLSSPCFLVASGIIARRTVSGKREAVRVLLTNAAIVDDGQLCELAILY